MRVIDPNTPEKPRECGILEMDANWSEMYSELVDLNYSLCAGVSVEHLRMILERPTDEKKVFCLILDDLLLGMLLSKLWIGVGWFG